MSGSLATHGGICGPLASPRGLKNHQQTEESCAQHIGRSVGQVDRWIKFKDMVTPEMQDRLSTWLGATRSELFSAMEPTLASSGKAIFANYKPNARADKLPANDRKEALEAFAADLDVDRDEKGSKASKGYKIEGWIHRKVVYYPMCKAIADHLEREADELFEKQVGT